MKQWNGFSALEFFDAFKGDITIPLFLACEDMPMFPEQPYKRE
jgi:hypothetical protein